MKAVSNAGPLIALGKLGQLGLLLRLFDEVLIPREVHGEVVVNGLAIGAPDARSVDFLIHNIKAQPNLWISESLCDQALAKARRTSSS